MAGNVLSREELAALLDDGKGRREQKVVDVDLARPTRISAERMKALTRLHEGLLERLAHGLSPLLRTKVKAELVSLGEQSFAALRASLPEPSPCHQLALPPLPERGLLIIDSRLAAAIIDRLLGGHGDAPEKPKPLTALDRALLDSATRRLIAEWTAAWKDLLPFTATVDQFSTVPSEIEGIPSAEPLLVATVRLSAPEGGLSGGECSFCLPLVDLEPALAKVGRPPRFAAARRQQTGDQRKHLDQVVGQATLEVVVTLGTTTLTIGEVLALAPGDVLVLDQRPGDPASVRVAGQQRALGRPGRSGNRLAVAIERTLPVPQPPAAAKEKP